VAYDDGTVACTDDELVIRRYYFPRGDKRIPHRTRKDLGKSVLSGNKGAEYDAFLSAKHGSSAKIVLKCERVIE
jgi:hypothetical protein